MSLTVALLGGTGQVGRLYARQALDAGHSIRALARDTGKLEVAEHPAVFAIQGDATSREDINHLIDGADVVVSCVGNPNRHTQIMEATANNVLGAAARQAQPPRCIFISSIGCGGTSWLIGRILSLVGGKRSWADYEAADLRIRSEQDVPFVLIRPYGLTNDPPKGAYRATNRPSVTLARPITRADVADFLLSATSETRWDGQPGVQLTGA